MRADFHQAPSSGAWTRRSPRSQNCSSILEILKMEGGEKGIVVLGEIIIVSSAFNVVSMQIVGFLLCRRSALAAD